MRIYTLYCLVLLWCCVHTSFSQRQDQNWYFGSGAAISWLNGSPVALDNSQMVSNEGCASISDRSTGKLLFYTNGKHLWDSNHIIQSTILNSGPSSAQGPIVVPDPSNPDQYYIFAAPDLTGAGVTQNLCYTLITVKPYLQIITANKFIQNEVSERIAVAFNRADGNYWIITHHVYDAKFLSYKLDSKGFNPTPIISNYAFPVSSKVTGQVKVSPNNEMVALSLYGGELKKLHRICYYSILIYKRVLLVIVRLLKQPIVLIIYMALLFHLIILNCMQQAVEGLNTEDYRQFSNMKLHPIELL